MVMIPAETILMAEREAKDRALANHKDAVETKRRTDARLRAALEGLQAIYTLCAARPSNADPEAMLRVIYQMAGDAFEKATDETPRHSQPCNTRTP